MEFQDLVFDRVLAFQQPCLIPPESWLSCPEFVGQIGIHKRQQDRNSKKCHIFRTKRNDVYARYRARFYQRQRLNGL